jgi:hypothetical protein
MIVVTYAQVKGSTTYLGRRFAVCSDEVMFGVDLKYAQNITEDGMGLKDLKGVNELRWEKEKDDAGSEVDAMGQAKYRSLVGQLSGATGQTTERPSESSRRSWTAPPRWTARVPRTRSAT